MISPFSQNRSYTLFFTGSYQLKVATAYLNAIIKDGKVPVKFPIEPKFCE